MTLTTQAAYNRHARISPLSGGTYTWKVGEDILYADATVATLFGIPVWEAEKGLPLNRYLQRVHPEDLTGLSHAITAAMETGSPYLAEYRVISASGIIAPVLAMGQCFRDVSGKPTEYSGMVFDLSENETRLSHHDEMVESCIAAFESAKRAGNEFISYLLSMALIEIGQKDAEKLMPDEMVH